MVVKLAAALVLPAVFWSGYLCYKDRLRPEPLRNVAASFAMGAAAGFLCFEFFRLLALTGISADANALMTAEKRLPFLIYSLGVTGPVEELFKMLPFLLVVLRFRQFDEKTDGIVYGGTIALGFAAFENFLYLQTLGGPAFWGRAVASPLTHTVFASIWGYVVAKAVLEKRALAGPAVMGLFLSAVCHGLFNFLTSSPVLRFMSALLILAVWIWIIVKLEKASQIPAKDDKEPA